MNWLAITTIAYFLLSLEIILDKFLLSSKRVSHPAIYTFYSGTFGLFAFVFFPFGFHMISFGEMLPRFLAGIIFIYGMLALFFAINKSEASRVTPVVGAVVPITLFFLAWFFLQEHLRPREILGLILLIIGGLSISYDFSPERTHKLFRGFYWSILAGVLLALSAVLIKGFYRFDNFYNVFIWTRAGAFLGVLSFFLVPGWRRILFASLKKARKPEKEHKTSGLMFTLAKATGGTGNFLKEKATSLPLASVTIINAMVAMEYVFIFLLGIAFSLWLPNVFEEKKDWKSVVQKLSAIVVITTGIVLVSHMRK